MQGLERYSIQRVFSEGPLGVTYDALDRLRGTRVSVKTIAKEHTTTEMASSLLARFNHELQAASRLSHPGIVSLYDYGESQGRAYFVMEHVEGKCLQDYFDSAHVLPLPEIVRIMGELLDALDYAHRNGIVHTSINLSNVMITDENRVKVDDFGLARIASHILLQARLSVGTPVYMSPEQLQLLSFDGRSDIFSAGGILYQLLTGQFPFGNASIEEILTHSPRPPSKIRFSIPKELDMVVAKALSKCAQDRFASAADLAEALQKAVPSDVPAEACQGEVESSDSITRNNWEVELECWGELTDSTEVGDFEAFLLAFPKSPLAPLVRRRIEKMRRMHDSSVAYQRSKVDISPEKDSQEQSRRGPRRIDKQEAVGVTHDGSAQMHVFDMEGAPQRKELPCAADPIVMAEQPSDRSAHYDYAATREPESETPKSGTLLRRLLFSLAALLAIGLVAWSHLEVIWRH